MKYAALIRGINVAGHRKLPMPALAKMFSAAKCTDVITYLNSGNVVFAGPAAVVKNVPVLVAATVAKKFGYSPVILLRDAHALALVVAENPFPKASGPHLHVAFLASAPASLTGLSPAPDEKLELRGKHLYMWLPRGAGQSKLSNQLVERKLGTVATMRNWNTVTKLAQLTSPAG